jgi:hypothetical protein
MPNKSTQKARVEHNLARRVGRLQARAGWSLVTVSEDAHRFLRRIQAESKPLMVVLQREQEAAQVFLEFARRHGVGAPRHLPRAQKRMGKDELHCGSSPFPWIVNVGNACYLDSVVTCLFHCAAPRQHVLAMPRASELHEALQDLLRDYVEGMILEPAGAAPWHWDVLAPCRLVDAVDSASRGARDGHDLFDFGLQHDAASLLSFLLAKTGMGAACFAAHAPGNPGARPDPSGEDLVRPPVVCH